MQGNEFSFDIDGKTDKTSSPKEKISFNLDPNVVESTTPIKVKPKSGKVKTGINVFRSFVALGVLTLPYAFSLTGLWLSVLLLAFTTWIAYYGVSLFLDIAEDLGFNGSKVEDLCKLAGGRIYGKLGSISIIVAQLSCAIASVVFTVDFMDYVFCHHNVESLCHHKLKFLAFSFLISSCIVMIENLACFAYISLISIMAILTSLITILYYDISFVFDKRRPVAPYSAMRLGGSASFIGISLFAMEVADGE